MCCTHHIKCMYQPFPSSAMAAIPPDFLHARHAAGPAAGRHWRWRPTDCPCSAPHICNRCCTSPTTSRGSSHLQGSSHPSGTPTLRLTQAMSALTLQSTTAGIHKACALCLCCCQACSCCSSIPILTTPTGSLLTGRCATIRQSLQSRQQTGQGSMPCRASHVTSHHASE